MVIKRISGDEPGRWTTEILRIIVARSCLDLLVENIPRQNKKDIIIYLTENKRMYVSQ